MVILALETATRAGSLALSRHGTTATKGGDASRTHSVRLPGEVLDFLASEGCALTDLDYFAVVTGPGSFTGLRIGLATVQGLAFATGRQVIPVPTMSALASAWILTHPGTATRLATCVDGARGEVFWAVHDIETSMAIREVVPAAVSTPLQFAARLQELSDQVITIAGDGATRYEHELRGAVRGAIVDSTPLYLATGAVRVAERAVPTAVVPHALRPEYVRRPDAVLARARLRREVAAPTAPEPEGVTIRRAESADELHAVAALQRTSFSNAWGAEAIRWEIENTDVARLYVAVTPAGEVVAYCSCWIVFDELHINSLAVAETWRRRGLAIRLLRNILEDAARAGARGATLEVRQSNEAARGLYGRLGFQIEGIRRNYYQNPKEDGLILWLRHLTPSGG